MLKNSRVSNHFTAIAKHSSYKFNLASWKHSPNLKILWVKDACLQMDLMVLMLLLIYRVVLFAGIYILTQQPAYHSLGKECIYVFPRSSINNININRIDESFIIVVIISIIIFRVKLLVDQIPSCGQRIFQWIKIIIVHFCFFCIIDFVDVCNRNMLHAIKNDLCFSSPKGKDLFSCLSYEQSSSFSVTMFPYLKVLILKFWFLFLFLMPIILWGWISIESGNYLNNNSYNYLPELMFQHSSWRLLIHYASDYFVYVFLTAWAKNVFFKAQSLIQQLRALKTQR